MPDRTDQALVVCAVVHGINPGVQIAPVPPPCKLLQFVLLLFLKSLQLLHDLVLTVFIRCGQRYQSLEERTIRYLFDH